MFGKFLCKIKNKLSTGIALMLEKTHPFISYSRLEVLRNNFRMILISRKLEK